MSEFSTPEVSFGLFFTGDELENLLKEVRNQPNCSDYCEGDLMEFIGDTFNDGYTHSMYYDGEENTVELIVTPDGKVKLPEPGALFVIDSEGDLPSPYEARYSKEKLVHYFSNRYGYVLPDGFDIASHIGTVFGEVFTG